MTKPTEDEWMKEARKPLSMHELAKWWLDSLKVAGGGNGAGFIAAGAALNYLSTKPHLVLPLKIAIGSFFVGVVAFAIAFICVNVSRMAYDDYLHEVRHSLEKKDPSLLAGEDTETERLITSTNKNMMSANWLAIVSAGAFFVGCIAAMWALIRF